jgi:DNA-binding transcriptional MerR regulator
VVPEQIPDIDLYMDQVTTFMEEHLKDTRRYPEDKVLTKTMINNYAKNNLLPPPVKKKYSKDHMLMLIFIYYFKNLLSFSDIETLFAPLTSKHFGGDPSGLSLEDIYREVFALEKEQMGQLKNDIQAKFARAQETFSDTSVQKEDTEYLRLFSFICELSFDVYMKTKLIELLSDQLKEEAPAPTKKK